MSKRILITGAAGFIGSHLCAKILADNHHITALDNLISGDFETIKPLIQNKNFNFHYHDVKESLPALLGRFDQIYNLACPASPPHYQKAPIDTLLTSVLGVKNLLDASLAMGARFLQASTSEIYGNPLMHPQPESYFGNVNPIGPRACYDEGKRAAETLCFDYHRQHGADIKVIRIFNTYGPHMRADDGRVVSNFINQALRGADLTLYGDGQQTRSFCYVDDLVRGIIAMMESPAGFPGPVNLGNPDEFTVEELAELVLELTGSESALVYKPLPADDPLQRQPDISLAKQQLNWEPTIKLRLGLERTIRYFREIASQ